MELEEMCRRAYGAYEYLRDHDLSGQSGTSKRLRAGNLEKLRARLAEELLELRGVIEGTHRHEGFDQDIILEGYEVFYWAVCLAVAAGHSYDTILPHAYLSEGFQAEPGERQVLLNDFERLAKAVTLEPNISLGENPPLSLALSPQAFKDRFVGSESSKPSPLSPLPEGEGDLPPSPVIFSVEMALLLVGKACALNATSPTRLIERDLSEMSQKDYLAAYWEGVPTTQ